jgi:hypothetical protein
MVRALQAAARASEGLRQQLQEELRGLRGEQGAGAGAGAGGVSQGLQGEPRGLQRHELHGSSCSPELELHAKGVVVHAHAAAAAAGSLAACPGAAVHAPADGHSSSMGAAVAAAAAARARGPAPSPAVAFAAARRAADGSTPAPPGARPGAAAAPVQIPFVSPVQISPVQISPVPKHLPGGLSRQLSVDNDGVPPSAGAPSAGAPSASRLRAGGKSLSENEVALAEELKRELKAINEGRPSRARHPSTEP